MSVVPIASTATTGGLVIKSDRSKLTLVDEESIIKQIQATHAPEYAQQFDVTTLLNSVQDILTLATSLAESCFLKGSRADPQLEGKSREVNHIPILKEMRTVVDRIAREISYRDLGRGNDDDTTLALFKMLSSYSWETKLVLTMAAFALKYAESCLLAQVYYYSSDKFSKPIGFLKQMRRKPFILELIETSKEARFDTLKNLIKVTMDVTKCVVEFTELPSIYISTDVPAFKDGLSNIPTAVYRTIRSIVACGTWINNLAKMGHESATTGTTEPWDESKLRITYEDLNKHLSICLQHIEEKKNDEAYIMLLNRYDKINIDDDNISILKDMFDLKNDVNILFNGSTRNYVKIDVLRRKTVLLLISGLDISSDALAILEQIYSESRIYGTMENNRYEVVWIPVVDQKVPYTEAMHMQFEALQGSMPWYTVRHPNMIKKVVIRFIKEIWRFRMEPVLVVLNPHGKVVCPNAFHMMWVWGSHAFPFTSSKEESLWNDETWRLDFLVNGIDLMILSWIEEQRYIFLYGGDDIEWIRKFTFTAKAVAHEAGIPLEMVYVGKSTKREKVRQVMEIITVENLSYVWPDMTMIWFFWKRIESMFFSKIQLGKNDEDDDPLMQEIKKLLSYDKEGGGWAVLSRGFNVVVNGHSSTVLQTLIEYDKWKIKQGPVNKDFDKSFKQYHDKLHQTTHQCCEFDFPSNFSRIPQRFICPQCGRAMEKFITFSCCNDDADVTLF